MAMATKLRWLPRLLLLTHSAFFLLSYTAALPWTLHHASGLPPVVLLPGSSCSQIEVRLTDAYEPPSPLCAAHKGDGQWHRLWKNVAATDADAPCFADQFRLVYDHDAGDYRNPPGVQTRALSFGSTRGFLADDLADKELCMGKLVEALERAGYRDGETLFGAPYDFRYAPAPSRTANREVSRFRRRLRELVERASRTNGDKPVILVSHSQGGYFALDFLNRSPLYWRRRFVKHLVMASTGAGGFVLLMQTLLPSSGSSTAASPADVLSLPRVRMIFPGTFSALPSPVAFGDDTPLVVTANRSYSARDMPAFLAAAGLPPQTVWLYETRALPVALSLGPPLVPMTCVNGVAVPTMEKLVYPDAGLDEAPEVVYGDGDGVVNLASILALDTVMGGDPRQEYYRSIRIANMSHRGVVSDALALDQLLRVILDAASPTIIKRILHCILLGVLACGVADLAAPPAAAGRTRSIRTLSMSVSPESSSWGTAKNIPCPGAGAPADSALLLTVEAMRTRLSLPSPAGRSTDSLHRNWGAASPLPSGLTQSSDTAVAAPSWPRDTRNTLPSSSPTSACQRCDTEKPRFQGRP